MGQREEVVKELLYSQFVVIHELKACSNLHCDLSPKCPALPSTPPAAMQRGKPVNSTGNTIS